MDENEHLRQLIAAAYQHPDASPEWQKAMHRLLITIQRLPEFSKYSRPEYPIYFLDALNRTWEWLSRNLRNFTPRSTSTRADLVKWINGYLHWRIRELDPSKSSSYISLDIPVANSEEGTTFLDLQAQTDISIPGLSGLDGYIEQVQKEEIQRTGLELELYIEQDPEGKLRRCHPLQAPDCNCQVLSQKLYLKHPPDSLADIAREFNMNYQTVVWHWKRKGLPLLQQIAIELQRQPNQKP